MGMVVRDGHEDTIPNSIERPTDQPPSDERLSYYFDVFGKRVFLFLFMRKEGRAKVSDGFRDGERI